MNDLFEIHNKLLTNEMSCYLRSALNDQVDGGWEGWMKQD